MNVQNLKDKLYNDRLWKGVFIGVLSVLALEFVILLSVLIVRSLPEKDGVVKVPSEAMVAEVASGSEAEKTAERKEVGKAEEDSAGGKTNRSKLRRNDKRDGDSEELQAEDTLGSIYEYGIPIMLYQREEGVIRRGDFFSTVMARLGASQSDIYALDAKAKGVFDMRQFKVGNNYHAYYSKEDPERLAYIVYEKDRTSYVLFTLEDTLSVQVYEKDITTEVDYVEVTIENSLWQDVIDSGAPALLAIRLADIYAWTIDFFGLQKGDSFNVVFEKTVCDGEILNVEDVLYAEFTHGNESFKSYWFDDGSGNYYWNEKGESMRKAFLKAPLSYTRISSGFTYRRLHPVTRKVRPHTGVDYAAPTGTEVMSIGDGVVVYKGYKRAEGNMVKIKHNSVYTSAYLHLSRYGKGVEVGQRVRQGQVIGYVGSTGYSTGPHLDFRIWKNGTPINPLKMDSPPAKPIAKKDMQAFLDSRAESERAANTFQAKAIFMDMLENITEK